MNLVEVVRPECIVARTDIRDKNAALLTAVDAAKRCSVLKDIPDKELLDALKEREEIGTTAFGKGIAIPHCRLAEVSEFVVGIVTSEEGFDFAALDDQAVQIMVFIVGPKDGSNDHIRILSAVSQALLSSDAKKEIVAARTPEAVRESFLRHTRADIHKTRKSGLSQIQVFVQDETLFHDILGQVAGTTTGSLLVLEGENAAAYLHRTPLFARLLRDEAGGFCRMILLTIDRRLTNETLRRIETTTGHLDERNDVLVTVTNLAFAAGSLGAFGKQMSS